MATSKLDRLIDKKIDLSEDTLRKWSTSQNWHFIFPHIFQIPIHQLNFEYKTKKLLKTVEYIYGVGTILKK